MNSKTFKFFIVEGLKSFFKNGLLSAASVITVSLSLILFGVYVLFSMNLNYAAMQIETNYEIQIFIDENADSSLIGQIELGLGEIENINTITFVAKGQALKQWIDSMADNIEALEGLEDDNPLRDSFRITFKNLQYADETLSEIKAIQGVSYIKNNKDVVDKLVDITDKIKKSSFYFMLFFAVISIFIISNSIRITVFARRREVNIMKFVGATDWFIRLPFMIEGIIIGIVGAIISAIIVSSAYGYFLSTTGVLIETTVKLLKTGQVTRILIAYLAGGGIVLGALGSSLSLRKHLYV
ncbi:MAG: permease-like cell division protein FtsX [Firmicutes bacterium]|nr:permease-like cell division protein FtsX [Bacillota bacterium]